MEDKGLYQTVIKRWNDDIKSHATASQKQAKEEGATIHSEGIRDAFHFMLNIISNKDYYNKDNNPDRHDEHIEDMFEVLEREIGATYRLVFNAERKLMKTDIDKQVVSYYEGHLKVYLMLFRRLKGYYFDAYGYSEED